MTTEAIVERPGAGAAKGETIEPPAWLKALDERWKGVDAFLEKRPALALTWGNVGGALLGLLNLAVLRLFFWLVTLVPGARDVGGWAGDEVVQVVMTEFSIWLELAVVAGTWGVYLGVWSRRVLRRHFP